MIFFNSLNEQLTGLERTIQALPGELEAAVQRIDIKNWDAYANRINADVNKLVDSLMFPKTDGVIQLRAIFDTSSGYFHNITQADTNKWRKARLPEIRVIIGKGKISVVKASDLVHYSKEPGCIVLDWPQYEKLVDAIGKLIRQDDTGN